MRIARTISGVTKTCPHCRTVVNADDEACPSCGADLAPAPPTSRLPHLDPRVIVLWGALVLPGFVLVLLGALVVESLAVVIAGLVMLAIPLLLQLFGGSWRGVG